MAFHATAPHAHVQGPLAGSTSHCLPTFVPPRQQSAVSSVTRRSNIEEDHLYKLFHSFSLFAHDPQELRDYVNNETMQPVFQFLHKRIGNMTQEQQIIWQECWLRPVQGNFGLKAVLFLWLITIDPEMQTWLRARVNSGDRFDQWLVHLKEQFRIRFGEMEPPRGYAYPAHIGLFAETMMVDYDERG